MDSTKDIKLENNNIYNEDCITGMNKIEDESVNIIIADPPYNIGKDFGNNRSKKQIEEYLIWCDKWLNQCIRILKKNGTMYIYGFSEILPYIQMRIHEKLNIRWLIWHYKNKTTPNSKFWQRSHESILVCWKDSYIFNKDDVREPYSQQYLKVSGKPRKSTEGRFGKKETIYKAHESGAQPRDVINMPALSGGSGKKERVNHPTQKPLELCEKLIKSSMDKNGRNLIVIPFAGSGSECVTAKRLKLDYIGFEINNEYIEISNKRLEEITI
jgi:site-specific DNA-methyltransferase (adenine-specific)